MHPILSIMPPSHHTYNDLPFYFYDVYSQELDPKIKIVGVDPRGSILAQPPAMNEQGLGVFYTIEGIGYDFVPDVLDRKYVILTYKDRAV